MTNVLGIVAVIGLALIVLRYAMLLKVKMKKGKEAPALSGRYEKAVRSGERALFYFYSDNCGACRPMTPIIEELAKKKKHVYKIDVANDMETAQRFGIMGTPSTVIVEAGKIKDIFVGALRREKLQEMF